MKKRREEGFKFGRYRAHKLMKTMSCGAQSIAYKVTTNRTFSDAIADN